MIDIRSIAAFLKSTASRLVVVVLTCKSDNLGDALLFGGARSWVRLQELQCETCTDE